MTGIPRQEGVLGVDADVDPARLLPAKECQRLVTILAPLLGGSVRLCNAEGELLAQVGDAPGTEPLPLLLDFETVATLQADAPQEALNSAVRLLEWWLGKQLQYLMAASLHHAIVESDYAELQERNRELEISEGRYKALAEQLETRVQTQVRTIKLAERQLYNNEKLASVGQLAAGVAHEINNPVGFVTSNLRMAGDYVEQLKGYIRDLEAQCPAAQRPKQQHAIGVIFEDFTDLLTESLQGCDRVTAIVKNLKDFSNVDGGSLSMGSVNDLLATVHELHLSKIPADIKVRVKPGTLPDLPMNGGNMAQVFANLLNNALDALRQGASGESKQVLISTVLEDGMIMVRFSDNGPGIDAAQQRRVFDPFYTSKPVGQGTGLGLTVCRDIVQAHGGHIQFRSQPGRGSLVVISLPLRPEPVV